ncbi:MAG: hypothetical protein QW503_05310, partial [Sulfolobales archaeon]
LELYEGKLWVGVTLNEWRPTRWAPMKDAPRSVKSRVGSKQHQPTRNPNSRFYSSIKTVICGVPYELSSQALSGDE